MYKSLEALLSDPVAVAKLNDVLASKKESACYFYSESSDLPLGFGLLCQKDERTGCWSLYQLGKFLGGGYERSVKAIDVSASYSRSDQKFILSREPLVVKLIETEDREVLRRESSFMAHRIFEQRPVGGFDRPEFMQLRHFEFLVMKRIPGENLGDILEKDRKGENVLTTAQRLSLAIAVLGVFVAQVQRRKTIHLDVKPENIMVNWVDPNQEPEVVFLDFGISQHDRERTRVSPGTVFFAPKEQVDQTGKVGSLSTASDTFSLGVFLALLFRDSKLMSLFNSEEGGSFLQWIALNLERTYDYGALFSDWKPEGLSDLDCQSFKSMLQRTADPCPEKRPSVLEIKHLLERLLLHVQSSVDLVENLPRSRKHRLDSPGLASVSSAMQAAQSQEHGSPLASDGKRVHVPAGRAMRMGFR